PTASSGARARPCGSTASGACASWPCSTAPPAAAPTAPGTREWRGREGPHPGRDRGAGGAGRRRGGRRPGHLRRPRPARRGRPAATAGRSAPVQENCDPSQGGDGSGTHVGVGCGDDQPGTPGGPGGSGGGGHGGGDSIDAAAECAALYPGWADCVTVVNAN